MLKPTIGLEIHVELKTNSKMFCSCKNDAEEKRPNFNICPTCMGHPGTLPVANEEAVKKVIKTGLALNCNIPKESKFDRKNYFYPDLPKGYQISQYDKPLCGEGYLEIPVSEDFSKLEIKKVKIRRVHLEEDTGRLLHPEGADYSLVDFNRAGIPLMELVTEPDLNSGLEVRRFAEEFQLILRYLGVSDADMEKGQMRVEVNISIGDGKKLGTKVEIKNLNSFKTAEKAVNYEIKRQTEVLKNKQKVIQETRGWSDGKGETFSQREKEEAHDYRYFPEPDLPPIILEKEYIDKIRAEIPELPAEKRKRLFEEYGLDAKSIEIFTDNKDLGEYFEKVISEIGLEAKSEKFASSMKLATNYIITDLQGLLDRDFNEKECAITPENFAEFIILINDEKITSKTAKEVLVEMLQTGKDPSQIIDDKGLGQVSDKNEIEKAVRKVIEENKDAVEDFKKGKQNVLQFLAGKVMAQTQGRAKPEIVQNLLKKLLA
ncbi:Asp-tRNA(Asn)/Glu-tRNA(Gln) amidotransferase subunit GatB [Patescibacteria group bacterium]|nr:Asp-tRNA(Asn)/Glu-tRNA(Gln) amidotransferase subunit GatB [Patescibacteria group bacterium]MBU4367736.1 Asp-tRNA(Asn)/Glu-tRNA(Gln) amidotransferase subunit GatB [Patescibacteria group bacterium]MBU4461814.1 Asp-tRNA(Asn)/Glu-tRNA(Gln) amidotransferase subunit GatB [Patescibacteria group bacterium]MCG2700055.1 Asp-tRNA(Asn)/Glu-tRNA(Gln) amidotransferase subunit GatB [Candidatus Parcubacteria bacterium]